MTELLSLLGLFVVAFGAATLLPLQSEVVFVAMQADARVALPLIVVVASVGNTLGAMVNYIMGRWVEHFRDRRWFPVSPAKLARAQAWYARYGVWTLLFSWAPLGDGFTVVAGMMRTPLWLFVGLVALAKTGRYVALALITAGILGG
ncbi:DedA family protein [Defluviimonas sp. WL0050]|uniref:DedA family protein n=1 Tax=Albidovulum litorale TaxID=2984134 RepID=A0ABT2ZSA7_9RHOB|nr:YqaA family protein [Defluviimonas sp. WL0050]MCV2874028.1 DedA family protein [Defluviimonas sp. WL0050]